MNLILRPSNIASALVAVLLTFRLFGADAASNPRAVTPAQLETLVGERKDVVILDVRTPAERAGGQLAHSINVDARATDFPSQLDKLDRSKTYVVHCVHGRQRTTDSVRLLGQLGFTNVLTLEGGYDAWVKAGKPVEGKGTTNQSPQKAEPHHDGQPPSGKSEAKRAASAK